MSLKSFSAFLVLFASGSAFAHGNLVSVAAPLKLEKAGKYLLTYERQIPCYDDAVNVSVLVDGEEEGIQLVLGESIYQGPRPMMCREEGGVEVARAFVEVNAGSKLVLKQDLGSMDPATVRLAGFKLKSVELLAIVKRH